MAKSPSYSNAKHEVHSQNEHGTWGKGPVWTLTGVLFFKPLSTCHVSVRSMLQTLDKQEQQHYILIILVLV